ncbi:PhoH family protein [uncultured Cocleimonas sp.]|uniref:PhoH family protein n=1 Tax=uncultured Cocleimonas sp. TaxID=1051587 RepID=UPI00260CE389|nr:PhoH family protein [uncultured Cocleimonas sp.]
MADKIYVIDTNIILHNPQGIKQLSQDNNNIVVIPETVLVELEEFKKGSGELSYQARSFARMLAACKVDKIDQKKECRVVKLRFNDSASIHLFSKNKYESDLDAAHIAESNDKRIVEVAEAAQSYYKGHKIIFLSLDIYARMFGLFSGIKVQTLYEDRSDLPPFHFFKSIEVDSSLFNGMQNSDITDYDDNYQNDNFNYEFVSKDGNRQYGIVSKGGKIDIVNEKEDFNGLSIKPMNMKQMFLLKAMLSDYFDITVVDAKAGSGKTLLAFAAAMRLIDLGHYEKIVYVRNSIESVDKGAEVGFLSGNDEKFRVYNMALYDTLEFIAKTQLKRRESVLQQEALEMKVEYLVNKYNIEKLWPGEARGRTLSNAIVILDEWQNSSNNTTQLVLSRLDQSCKAIIIGSNRQIDNIYLNRYNNGLTTLLKQTTNKHEEVSMYAIELERSVRGKFAQFAEEIFEKREN